MQSRTRRGHALVSMPNFVALVSKVQALALRAVLTIIWHHAYTTKLNTVYSVSRETSSQMSRNSL